VVCLFSDIPDGTRTLMTNVAVDYEMQGFLAAKHLLDKGCRRLAHLRTIDKRYKGFLRAHREKKLKVDPKLVIAADGFLFEDGKKCLDTLLKSRVPFDGIVCQSDTQAVGVINELVRLGIDIPGAVKVTGVDNSPMAESCIIPITSVTSGMQRAGLTAVEFLLRKIEGESVKPTFIEPELVVRRSSSLVSARSPLFP
jgi:LacI family transcriptional regulator